ncbi:MAG: polyphosphate polymerase domain-containing protein [Faecousia sp.]
MSAMRYELKYEVNEAVLPLLRARLRAVMHADRHSGPDGYLVRSLYFDDLDCAAYRDKLNGNPERSKLRLRYYNGDESYIVLENKEKLGRLTRKTAQEVSREVALAMVNGDRERCLEARGAVMDQFLARGGTRSLKPRVLVDYRRTAFVHSVSNVRITLDEKVSTGLYRTDLFDREAARLPVLDPGRAVVEVKFDHFLPDHLDAALRDIPMVRLAVSKYVKCLGVLE